MKRHTVLITLTAWVVATVPTIGAEETAGSRPKTIVEVHPRLALGALTFAKATKLPEGMVLRADGVELHTADVNKVIAGQPPELQGELKKNAYLVLNQLATRDILGHLAKEALSQNGQDDGEEQAGRMIQSYLEEKVLDRVTVTDAEVKQLYEAEKSMLGGAAFEQMQASLKQYLLGQKKQAAVTGYIRDLGKSMNVEVSASWLKKQAISARDNPVDKARDSGRPSLVDFGATGCGPCDMMAPILEELKTKHKGKVNVLFVHVREKQILAAKYGIQNIPVQVFFDKKGNEVFRHVGFFAQEEIEKKLAEMGVGQ